MTVFDSSKVQKQVYALPQDATFTILIPSWNNLAYLKCCVESIRQNSRFRHQVVVHVNEGTDGTLDWVQEQEIDYTHTPENVGVCYSVNSAAGLARTDYMVYMNDDMYVCPAWDHFLREEIKKAPDLKYFFSSTLIEPRNTGNACVIATDEFGDHPDRLDKKSLLEKYADFPMPDWNGATWPPNLVHRKMFELVGGLSVEYSPGMYSDPDFSMKLWQAGVRLFKGVSESRVFHFQAATTHRIVKNDGRKQFMRKWKLPSSGFMKHYLKIGTPFAGHLADPEDKLDLKLARLRALFA